MAIFPVGDPKYDAVFAEEAAMVDASELIAEALEESGMTKADLARALGVSRSEITHRLQGERNITVRSLAATLHALGQTLDLSRERKAAPKKAYEKWAEPSRKHEESTTVSRRELAANWVLR